MQYANLNDFRLWPALNEYGQPEYDLTPCRNRPILREEINKDESEILDIAKAVIFKNRKYTGVDDINKLVVPGPEVEQVV